MRSLRLLLAVPPLLLVSCADDGDDTATAETSAAADPTSAPAVSSIATSTVVSKSTVPTTSAPEPPSTAPGTTAATSAANDFSAISPIVQAYVDENGLNGAGLIVVDRDDGIVYEDYWGEFDADRISLVASSSKMVTAGVLLRLQDDGLLDIDAPISQYVEWGSGNPDVTVAQLLSNSSGLVGLLPDPLYAPYSCQGLPAGTLQDCAQAIFTTTDDDADVIAPDTEFRYGGAQWQIAGAVAEAVSGTSWAQLIDEIYIQPCGLESLGFNNHWTQFGIIGFTYPDGFSGDPSTLAATDNPNMEGGMYVTTGDYAKLLLMHLRGGACDGNPVLSQAALDAMHADRIGEVYDGDALSPTTGYGMGWWVDRESGRVRDPGAYGAVPWLDLDDGFGAYLVVESDNATGEALAALLYDPVEAAITGAP